MEQIDTIRKLARVTEREARRIANELGKVSNAIAYYFPDRTPFDFQAKYLDDFSTKWLITDKARQIGWSQSISFRAIARAIAIPRYKKVFCSLNLDDAREKIEYANELYDAIGEIETVPAKLEDRKMSIKLANGSRLVSMFSPRGKARADISLDEFAHYQNARKVYSAALPIMIHKGSQIDIGSTTLHSQTLFKQIFRGDGGQYKKWTRLQIFWWDSPMHCVDVKVAREEAPLLATKDRIEEFGSVSLKEIFENMPLEDFQQEFELTEMDDELALLPWDLIHACTPTGKESEKMRFYNVESLSEATKGHQLFGGFDVGRWHDRSELTIFEDVDGVLIERYLLSLKRMAFERQEEIIDAVCSLPNMARFEIDATGMGEQIAENAEHRHPGVAKAIKFSHPMKATLATTTKKYMEKGIVKFYPDRNRIYQMHSIKKEISRHGNVIYAVDKSVTETGKEKHHGDAFWSRALAIHSHADMYALGRPTIDVIVFDEEESDNEDLASVLSLLS